MHVLDYMPRSAQTLWFLSRDRLTFALAVVLCLLLAGWIAELWASGALPL
ncbi:hypothetical protein HUK65_05865 [Rhodobacteraceae bacterium 2376]|uniref:Uncharacterized protein n=1 Tax=Rhabdonatronobacter sediminivivens TaxID=2743469 RepID=A0A7Z0HY93_9RHOB|nr:hypothetical protein [Rhabdonatronobacter sediminivivens]NYS24513.1 hypothetical protein [Rhabdonatronobacter sediminivivens]